MKIKTPKQDQHGERAQVEGRLLQAALPGHAPPVQRFKVLSHTFVNIIQQKQRKTSRATQPVVQPTSPSHFSQGTRSQLSRECQQAEGCREQQQSTQLCGLFLTIPLRLDLVSLQSDSWKACSDPKASEHLPLSPRGRALGTASWQREHTMVSIKSGPINLSTPGFSLMNVKEYKGLANVICNVLSTKTKGPYSFWHPALCCLLRTNVHVSTCSLPSVRGKTP